MRYNLVSFEAGEFGFLGSYKSANPRGITFDNSSAYIADEDDDQDILDECVFEVSNNFNVGHYHGENIEFYTSNGLIFFSDLEPASHHMNGGVYACLIPESHPFYNIYLLSNLTAFTDYSFRTSSQQRALTKAHKMLKGALLDLSGYA